MGTALNDLSILRLLFTGLPADRQDEACDLLLVGALNLVRGPSARSLTSGPAHLRPLCASRVLPTVVGPSPIPDTRGSPTPRLSARLPIVPLRTRQTAPATLLKVPTLTDVPFGKASSPGGGAGERHGTSTPAINMTSCVQQSRVATPHRWPGDLRGTQRAPESSNALHCI